MDDLRYPIGRFTPQDEYSASDISGLIDQLAAAPAEMREAVEGLTPDQLRTPYRDGGWTVAQVVHHLPDSHLHSYARFRFALTEDHPTIKPYDEGKWANLPDASSVDVEMSLRLLDALHVRWVALMRAMAPADWARTYVHPERRGDQTLARTLGLYAWHGRHHVAHVTALRRRMGW